MYRKFPVNPGKNRRQPGNGQKNIPPLPGCFLYLTYFSLTAHMAQPAFFAFLTFLQLLAFRVILPHLCR
jgi:hypothetical protein